jgi:hypothetical protein
MLSIWIDDDWPTFRFEVKVAHSRSTVVAVDDLSFIGPGVFFEAVKQVEITAVGETVSVLGAASKLPAAHFKRCYFYWNTVTSNVNLARDAFQQANLGKKR